MGKSTISMGEARCCRVHPWQSVMRNMTIGKTMITPILAKPTRWRVTIFVLFARIGGYINENKLGYVNYVNEKNHSLWLVFKVDFWFTLW